MLDKLLWGKHSSHLPYVAETIALILGPPFLGMNTYLHSPPSIILCDHLQTSCKKRPPGPESSLRQTCWQHRFLIPAMNSWATFLKDLPFELLSQVSKAPEHEEMRKPGMRATTLLQPVNAPPASYHSNGSSSGGGVRSVQALPHSLQQPDQLVKPKRRGVCSAACRCQV